MMTDKSPVQKEYHDLVGLIRLLRRRIKRTLVIEALILTSTFFLPFLLGLFFLDNLYYLPPMLRALGIIFTFAVAAAIFMRRALPIFSSWSEERVAVRLEQQYPELDNRLINALQLGEKNQSALVIALVREALNTSFRLDFSLITGFYPLKKRLFVLAPLVLLAVLYLLIFPDSFLNASARIFNPLSSVSPLYRTRLEVKPGNTELAKGDSIKITAEVSGGIAPDAILEHKSQDGVARLEMNLEGRCFVFLRDNVTDAFQYRVKAGDAVSPWFQVQVKDKPSVEKFTIHYQYPEYTGLQNRTIESPSGDIKAVAGSGVSLVIHSTKPIDTSKMILSDGSGIPFTIESGNPLAASLSLVLEESKSYSVYMKDLEGYDNDPSPGYSLIVDRDQLPRISILSPAKQAILPQEERKQPVFFKAVDDFGVSLITPQLSVKRDAQFLSLPEIEINPASQSVEDGYTLDLTEAHESEAYYFRFAVMDNCRFPQPNVSYSQTIRIDCPGEASLPQPALDPETLNKLRKLKEKTEEFREVQKKAIEDTQKLLNKPADSWTTEDNLKTMQLAALEDQWAKFFEDAHSDLSKLPKLVSEDTALIEDTLEVYQEVQKVPDDLLPKPKTISVAEEQTGLELATELTTKIEKWLPDTPDHIKWEMGEPSKEYDIPLVTLPEELEDIIGDLIESEEDFTDEIEDVSSSWGDSLDKGAGWEAADGPISNYSAQGVTGNIMPNSNEIGGRSGEGRSGRSHGEFVESVAIGKEGRKTPTRLTNDPFEQGMVKDEMKQMTTGSTGGGKMSGTGGEGLRGPTPPHIQETLNRLSGMQAEFKSQAEKVKIAFDSQGLPTHNLNRALEGMDRMEEYIRNYQYQNILPEQHIILQNLKAGKLLATEKVKLLREMEKNDKKNWKNQISQNIKDVFPIGYEKIVEFYYKKLAEY
ncbi:hypothetical protein JW926_04175 [Candidatus Sumerlaeota bacterium]|nr:hypothetical protein [Candidatus Sumerlaeota bacterium]